MDDQIINELKEKIPQIIERQKETYLSFLNFIEHTLKPNENKIKDMYSLVFPGNGNYERLVKSAYRNIGVINNIIQKYADVIESINESDQISGHYLQLVFNTLNQSRLIQNIQTYVSTCNNWYNTIENDDINIQAKAVFIDSLSNLLSQTENIENIEYLQLAQIYAFKYFSNSEKNFVIIGANGSGKSSFARNSRTVLDKNVAIIPAQKLFILSRINSVSLGNSSRESLWNYQTEDKLCRTSDFARALEQDLQNVYKSLVEEQNAAANEYFEKNKKEVVCLRKETILEHVISIWNEILIHRKLEYKNGSLIVSTSNSEQKYDFMELSDGEKAIFYYIAHILLSKPNSFIIVDEPENHLHLAFVIKLWNRLEQERADCRFIYLTHNLDFAASRVNAEKLWMKKFTPPAQWDIERLPIDDELPEILYMELLGSRKPILFCEGTKSSLDYKLYIRLFSDYTIIPVEGHLQVISYTRTFNNSSKIHGNKAIGIIDGDYHTEEQKNKWKKDSIFCIEVQEVENILCDEDLLNACYESFYANEEKLNQAKELLFTKLEKDLESQVLEYATQTINEYLKANLIDKTKTEEELKVKLNTLLSNSSIYINSLIKQRREDLNAIIENRDYSMGICKYNNKGLIRIIPTVIEKDYKDKIFLFLDRNPEVLNILREKYFAEIPII